MKRFLFVTILTMIGLTLSFSQTEKWKLDKVHSNVMFTVRHLVISEVSGKFNEFDVELNAESEDFSDAGISASVNVMSIDTDNEQRDNHLKSDDFFNAELFPTMSFTSTSITKLEGNKYQIIGDLTIRDVTLPVTFDAELLGVIEAGRMGTRAGWKATTIINRFDYNLKWDRAIETGGLVVGEDVTISLNLEFVKAKSEA